MTTRAHLYSAGILLTLALAGCLDGSSIDAARPDAAPASGPATVAAGETHDWTWSGQAGEVKGLVWQSGCPTDGFSAAWRLDLSADGPDGRYWVFGPGSVVHGDNPLPFVRAVVADFRDGPFNENLAYMEAGEGDRLAVVLAIGSDVAWTLEGSMGIQAPECDWTINPWTIQNASFSDVPVEVGPRVVGFEYEVPSAGWTHVILPDLSQAVDALTRYDIAFPNGFRWADQSRHQGGGVSGAMAGYVGTLANVPGTLAGQWVSTASIPQAPTVTVIHMPSPPAIPLLEGADYCQGAGECRAFVPLPITAV